MLEIDFNDPTIKSVLIAVSSLLTYLIPPVKGWVNYGLGKIFPSLFIGEKKKVFQKILKMNDILYSIEALPNVKKAVLIETKNGGGIPKAGSEVRGTIVMPHRWNESFNNEVIDREYANVILNILNNKQYSYNVSDIPDGTMMSNMYNVQHIASCMCFEMFETRKKYTFLSIEFDCKLGEISIETKEGLRMKIGKFKEEMR